MLSGPAVGSGFFKVRRNTPLHYKPMSLVDVGISVCPIAIGDTETVIVTVTDYESCQ